ncbi:MAG: hypothetical protein NVSMB9_16110 [Isosphaeraceae bacterium]
MSRTWFKLGAAALAAVVLGCSEDNPTPKTDEASPTAGLSALDQMNQGAGGAKAAAEAGKNVDNGGVKRTKKK